MIIVSTLMPTYNHEKYIAEAIESFLKQKVAFDIELLIGDDCSTDNTFAIAQEYVKKNIDPLKHIKLIKYEKNSGLMLNYKTLLQKAQGKYIAILESDDVWIDSEKLQKQVDFLESNQNIGLVYSNFFAIDKNSEKNGEFFPDITEAKQLFINNPIAAVSVCFKKEIYDQYCDINQYIARNFMTFDYPVWISIGLHSGISKIDETLVCYRRIDTSISNNKSGIKRIKFAKSKLKIQFYILKLYKNEIQYHDRIKIYCYSITTYLSVLKHNLVKRFKFL